MSAWRLPFDVEGGDDAVERRRYGLVRDAHERFWIDAAEVRPGTEFARSERERRLRSTHPVLGKVVRRGELSQLSERRTREVLIEVVSEVRGRRRLGDVLDVVVSREVVRPAESRAGKTRAAHDVNTADHRVPSLEVDEREEPESPADVKRVRDGASYARSLRTHEDERRNTARHSLPETITLHVGGQPGGGITVGGKNATAPETLDRIADHVKRAVRRDQRRNVAE